MANLKKRRVKSVVWLTAIFWGSNYFFLELATAVTPKAHLFQLSLSRLITTAVGLLFCFFIHMLLRGRFLSTTRKRLIALAIVVPILAEIFAWTGYFALMLFDPKADMLRNFTWSLAVSTVSFWTWFFLAWSGMYLAIAYSFDVQEEQQRTAEIREQAHGAQLRALHSQINPHFLFNSLNSLSALILEGKTRRAEDMLGKLARFLRLGLSSDPNRKIPLSAEIELQKAYLELEQLRYEDLTVEFSVPETLASASVPALILQPVVENAVKHGVASSAPPASISIQARADGKSLRLQVTNSGTSRVSSSGTGIGLTNIIQRLGLIYGEANVELCTSRLQEGGFRTQLALPLEFI